ncbi:MAG: CopG family ribbon-helix-helix protein [Candidatus Aenigmarchaeota archaeon]|nr:CopG family ribbon-helix-helix protein [Candidatus Aenigmarchaeota archaeon]
MVKIISVSLNEKLLEEIDAAKRFLGFSGRSEVIRAGIGLLLDDLRAKEKLRGHAECVLVFVHEKKFEDSFTRVKHKYEGIINTQVHSNFCNDKCLQLCVLHGPAEKINGFFVDIRKNKRTEYAKLVVP